MLSLVFCSSHGLLCRYCFPRTTLPCRPESCSIAASHLAAGINSALSETRGTHEHPSPVKDQDKTTHDASTDSQEYDYNDDDDEHDSSDDDNGNDNDTRHGNSHSHDKHDEENDPIVHSFGPFGENILSRFQSFQSTSPERIRKPLKSSARFVYLIEIGPLNRAAQKFPSLDAQAN